MAKTQQAASTPGMVEVRVLVECEHGKPNDVVEISADLVDSQQKAGWVDGNAAAIAYAKSLKPSED